MDNKSKMYRCDKLKVFNNNRSVYASYENNKNDNLIINANDTLKKINNIINSDDFIYSIKVNIVTDNGIVIKKIVGLNNNNLVTIDNEYIPISIIRDIYK